MDIDLYESARNIVEARYIFQLMKSKGFSYQLKFKGGIKLNTSEQMYTTCKRE
jgi:pentatricopeptide repeat protein